MDLSIIIVNWNTRNLLEKCLKSVIKFTCDIQFEIIVVDNGSSDRSVGTIKSMFPSVILIENEKNMGFSKAVNQGLKIAKGENLLLLNSDTYIKNNTFHEIVAFLEARPDITALSCKVFYPDGKIQPALAKYPSLLGAVYNFLKIVQFFPNCKLFDKLNVSKWDYNASRELTPDLLIGGGCFMIRKSGVEQIGYMDEMFTPAYCEDADWCFRLKNKGLKMYYLAEAEIYHYHGYTCRKSDEIFKEYLTLATQKNRQYFFKKHYRFHKLLMLKCFDFLQNMLFALYIAFRVCVKFKSNEKEINNKLKLYLKLMINSF